MEISISGLNIYRLLRGSAWVFEEVSLKARRRRVKETETVVETEAEAEV